MKRKSFHIPDSQINALKEATKKTGIKEAELIRQAIEYYFKNVMDELMDDYQKRKEKV